MRKDLNDCSKYEQLCLGTRCLARPYFPLGSIDAIVSSSYRKNEQGRTCILACSNAATEHVKSSARGRGRRGLETAERIPTPCRAAEIDRK